MRRLLGLSRVLRLGVVFALLTAVLALPGVTGAAPGDVDNDTIADATDNCPSDYNLNQRDLDEDGVGDVCDPTPGVPGDRTLYAVWFRDALTDGPIPACATFHWFSQTPGFPEVDFDRTDCFRSISVELGSSMVTIELLAAPDGCTALWGDTFTFGPPAQNELGTVQVLNLWFVCGDIVLLKLKELKDAAERHGLGPGGSLHKKIQSIIDAYTAGHSQSVCGKLEAFINEVRAQSGKKINELTAAELIGRAGEIVLDLCAGE